MPRLSIVIPAFNEEQRLPVTLEAVAKWLSYTGLEAECIVVDDGSTDSTAEVAARFHGARVLRSSPNRGKGHAVRQGVLASSGDRVLVMDADLATPLEEFAKLSQALDRGAAVAIGSRPLRESELIVRQPWPREWAGRVFNAVVRLLAVPGIHDTQCGFKLFTRTAARSIFEVCSLDGFGYDVESLFVARRMGFSVAEIPVRWRHQAGAAAFSTPASYLAHGIRMVADIWRVRRLHGGRRAPRATRDIAPKQ